MSEQQPTVALLGTGTMGAGMARTIAAAGIPLRVWNRTRAKAEPLADVAAIADTPAEAVRGADVVLTMLFDTDSVRSAVEEARDGLAEGTVWLQQSTVGVAGTEELLALAGELGLVYVDAPVLGTKKPAEDGALVVLAAGPEDARDQVTPIFEAIGSRTVWVGADAGDATKLKLVANSWVLTVVEGIAEALSLATALGVEPTAFLDAVKGGATDAPYVQLKGKAMLEGDFTPSFGLDGAAKDASLILDAARDAGADVEFVEIVQRHFARAQDAGHGDLDLSATYLAH